MSVCVYSLFVLSSVWVAALRQAGHSSKESYRLCKNDYETEEDARAQLRAVKPLLNEWMNLGGLKVYVRIKTQPRVTLSVPNGELGQ
jgi:hypothetical protein